MTGRPGKRGFTGPAGRGRGRARLEPLLPTGEELQVLLGCWVGACPTCKRPAPRWLRRTGRARAPTSQSPTSRRQRRMAIRSTFLPMSRSGATRWSSRLTGTITRS